MGKGNKLNRADMTYKFLKLITLQIPEFGRIIFTSCENLLPIGREGSRGKAF